MWDGPRSLQPGKDRPVFQGPGGCRRTSGTATSDSNPLRNQVGVFVHRTVRSVSRDLTVGTEGISFSTVSVPPSSFRSFVGQGPTVVRPLSASRSVRGGPVQAHPGGTSGPRPCFPDGFDLPRRRLGRPCHTEPSSPGAECERSDPECDWCETPRHCPVSQGSWCRVSSLPPWASDRSRFAGPVRLRVDSSGRGRAVPLRVDTCRKPTVTQGSPGPSLGSSEGSPCVFTQERSGDGPGWSLEVRSLLSGPTTQTGDGRCRGWVSGETGTRAKEEGDSLPTEGTGHRPFVGEPRGSVHCCPLRDKGWGRSVVPDLPVGRCRVPVSAFP